MRGRSRSKELSTNTLKTPPGNTCSSKQTITPQWNCFKSSTTKVRLSTGSMGITLDPVSKPAWREGSPRCNMYPFICIFFLSSYCIALHKKREREIHAFISSSLFCFAFSWAVRMPKFSSWNDEQLLCFNFIFIRSLQLIFSKNWVCWSQKKKFALNLKFCGLRVHVLSLSCWGIWYDELELL